MVTSMAELGTPLESSTSSSDTTLAGISVYSAAAGFYVACLKAGYIDEAQEFAEWFLDEFDLDLET